MSKELQDQVSELLRQNQALKELLKDIVENDLYCAGYNNSNLDDELLDRIYDHIGKENDHR